MSEQRKLTTILAADVAGYSRLAGADEERTLARLRALRSDLFDPTISIHHGRVVKRTGDGILVEFRSPVEAARCAIEVQGGMAERNVGLPPERQILFRVGIHLGDVVEEADGDLMGDAVNIVARLEGVAEPGGICLSNTVFDQVRGKIAAEFADLGEKQLKNIDRPVRVYAVKTRPESHLSNAAASDKAGPPRLSIVVLPFANIGGDPEQEYFVDGVTESLTTDLSRISGSFVIARNTAFTYKGKPVDLKQIGKDLNVRYVLEGSVQKGGNRLRVNVQLIDAETSNHLWAERFDKPLADLLDMQDEIVARLASQLDTQLIVAEARRADISAHPDSMDLYFKGAACLQRGETPANAAQAIDFFSQALTLDPANIRARIYAAYANVQLAVNGPAAERANHAAAAEALAIEVLSEAPNYARAHRTLGSVYVITNRLQQGIAELEHALALDRNLAGAHAVIGLAKIGLGRSEEVEAYVLEALRLSPRDVMAYHWMHVAGLAKLCLGRDDEAAVWFRRSVEANRNWIFVHLYLASALAHLGREEEARAAARAGLALDPTFTSRRMRNVLTAAASNPVFAAQRERIFDGLRKAGVPEGEPEKLPAPRLSIVVLPFANIGGDPEQEYFVDGVTESLTTDLSRISGSFVIGRNTAFTYKGKAVDLKQIGRDLNVRYVLEGSVQRGGNRLRVNVQLIDAETGTHLWAERFDKPVADLFDMQDEIVARLAGALNSQLIVAEARRAEKSPHPDSMDLYFQGKACENRGWSPENMAQARGFYERALALDPSNINAALGAAWVDTASANASIVDDREKRLAGAEKAAIDVLKRAPAHAFAHFVLGFILMFTNRVAQGIAECQRALALDRNLAAAHGFIGHAKYALGVPEETEAHILEAARLSPNDSYAPTWLTFAGVAKFFLSDYEGAVVWFRRALETNSNFPVTYFYLAAALIRLGETTQAREAAKAGFALDSSFNISRFRATAASDNPTYLAGRDRVYEAMRKAGVPEG